MSAERVVVVGASGFGRECLDVLAAMAGAGVRLEVLGVVDDSPSPVNLKRLAARGTAHIGSVDEFIARGQTSIQYVLGIGDPAIRRRIVSRLDAAGFSPLTAIHPSASIGSALTLSEGVVVCARAVISTNVRLGRHVHVNPSSTIGHDSVLRDFVSVNPGAVISGEVAVGARTLVGASATILQGLTVGGRVVVGAGSVVTHDVPPSVVVKGVPGSWS